MVLVPLVLNKLYSDSIPVNVSCNCSSKISDKGKGEVIRSFFVDLNSVPCSDGVVLYIVHERECFVNEANPEKLVSSFADVDEVFRRLLQP